MSISASLAVLVRGKAITVGGTAWRSGTEEASGFLVTLGWHPYSPARSGLNHGLIVMTPRWYLLKQPRCTSQDHVAIHSASYYSASSFPGTWENLVTFPIAAGVSRTWKAVPLGPGAWTL